MIKDKRIEQQHYEDESYWVYLNTGWCDGERGSHLITGDTQKEARERMRRVCPCDCEECKKRLKQPKGSKNK